MVLSYHTCLNTRSFAHEHACRARRAEQCGVVWRRAQLRCAHLNGKHLCVVGGVGYSSKTFRRQASHNLGKYDLYRPLPSSGQYLSHTQLSLTITQYATWITMTDSKQRAGTHNSTGGRHHTGVGGLAGVGEAPTEARLGHAETAEGGSPPMAVREC